ncbi:UDP-galactose translocator-like [Stylophora pistillata]|uniref:UDP-galactose translocator n=1 Tax=Stylophora pistillata TaxID=50429 RepID=A0A2B4RQP3_STYPI|nr:UDP-galactose translocator-like [Stylophora pistillata]PFX18667.1 UDP-galactose translocator [Stylophora pistillata]
MAVGGQWGIKVWSLIILTVQNASLILTMRYTRTLPGDMYFASTAVMLTEVVKVITSMLILLAERRSMMKWMKYLYSISVGHPWDMVKMLVPACIYTVQNNLLYLAVSNLDAATYQVSYQLKILTTALFSIAMLSKPINRVQWLSLFMLFVGVSVVQLQPVHGPVSQSPEENISTQNTLSKKHNPLLGLAAVVASSMCSGFAGVYFEKTLKGTATPLWARNFQLAMFGVIIGTMGMYINDGIKIKEKGIFFGYHKLVWLIIAMQAFGGLLVGVVVKYADNILKGFAAAVSIVVSCIVSVYLFQFSLSLPFVSGAGLVMLATYLYGIGQKSVVQKSSANGSIDPNKTD